LFRLYIFASTFIFSFKGFNTNKRMLKRNKLINLKAGAKHGRLKAQEKASSTAFLPKRAPYFSLQKC